jgi:hypothetical protein
MNVKAIYNPRKPNGDVSSVECDVCGKIGAAYIELMTSLPHRFYEAHKTLICKSCLDDWDKLINKSILQDVMDSVERRRRKENV